MPIKRISELTALPSAGLQDADLLMVARKNTDTYQVPLTAISKYLSQKIPLLDNNNNAVVIGAGAATGLNGIFDKKLSGYIQSPATTSLNTPKYLSYNGTSGKKKWEFVDGPNTAQFPARAEFLTLARSYDGFLSTELTAIDDNFDNISQTLKYVPKDTPCFISFNGSAGNFAGRASVTVAITDSGSNGAAWIAKKEKSSNTFSSKGYSNTNTVQSADECLNAFGISDVLRAREGVYYVKFKTPMTDTKYVVTGTAYPVKGLKDPTGSDNKFNNGLIVCFPDVQDQGANETSTLSVSSAKVTDTLTLNLTTTTDLTDWTVSSNVANAIPAGTTVTEYDTTQKKATLSNSLTLDIISNKVKIGTNSYYVWSNKITTSANKTQITITVPINTANVAANTAVEFSPTLKSTVLSMTGAATSTTRTVILNTNLTALPVSPPTISFSPGGDAKTAFGFQGTTTWTKDTTDGYYPAANTKIGNGTATAEPAVPLRPESVATLKTKEGFWIATMAVLNGNQEYMDSEMIDLCVMPMTQSLINNNLKPVSRDYTAPSS